MDVSERVRIRLRDEMKARDISQRELADLLTGQTNELWTQSRVQKVLTGYVELKIVDVDAIARCVGISLCEAVRDPGMEFSAEMTPTELRLFQRLQAKPQSLDAVLTLLNVPKAASDTAETKHLPSKPKRGRPLNSSRPVDESGDTRSKHTHHPQRPK